MVVTNNRVPKSVDIYAGSMLRKRRQELGMSQKELASKIGVTFQQIQKYEKGLNRIGASRLHDFCQILEIRPSYFFQDLGYAQEGSRAESQDSEPTKYALQEVVKISEDEILTLLQDFRKIKSPAKRKLVLDIVASYVS